MSKNFDDVYNSLAVAYGTSGAHKAKYGKKDAIVVNHTPWPGETARLREAYPDWDVESMLLDDAGFKGQMGFVITRKSA